jgi:ubiquinol-cytochrome c reductase iron-sulfur subunit
MSDTKQKPESEPAEVTRRDFIYVATAVVGGVGAVLTAWPFIDQMEPDAAAVAAGGPLTVDLSAIQPGQQVLVRWRSRPIFIVRRTQTALKELKSPSLLDRLRDPNSQQRQQPAYAQNWSRSIRPEYLVVVGICTHLGCIPEFKPAPGSIAGNWPGGYFCPCHGSKYDLAGRVFQGVPAPLNLPVPPYRFASDTSIVIGENPPGQSFSLSEVETL